MENTYTAVEKGYYLDSEQNSFVYSVNEKTYVPPLRYYMTMWDKNAKDYIVPTSGGASKVNPSLILNIFFHQFLWPLQLLTS